MINIQEKNSIIDHSDEIAATLLEGPNGSALFKVVTNYYEKTAPSNKFGKALTESLLSSSDGMKKALSDVIKAMLEIGTQSSHIEYSTGDLAKYFGVSTTSINNWIKEDRFLGVKRPARGKQLKISEDTIWVSSSNKKFTVKEIVEMWNQQYADLEKLTPKDEREILLQEIGAFENKYGGGYETTLKIKVNKTHADERIEEEWLYLLKRIHND